MGFYLSLGASQDVKESACSAGDLGSISESGRSPGERNGYHCSILTWRILWTEETGRGHRGLNRTEPLMLLLSLITQF